MFHFKIFLPSFPVVLSLATVMMFSVLYVFFFQEYITLKQRSQDSGVYNLVLLLTHLNKNCRGRNMATVLLIVIFSYSVLYGCYVNSPTPIFISIFLLHMRGVVHSSALALCTPAYTLCLLHMLRRLTYIRTSRYYRLYL